LQRPTVGSVLRRMDGLSMTRRRNTHAQKRKGGDRVSESIIGHHATDPEKYAPMRREQALRKRETKYRKKKIRRTSSGKVGVVRRGGKQEGTERGAIERPHNVASYDR